MLLSSLFVQTDQLFKGESWFVCVTSLMLVALLANFAQDTLRERVRA